MNWTNNGLRFYRLFATFYDDTKRKLLDAYVQLCVVWCISSWSRASRRPAKLFRSWKLFLRWRCRRNKNRPAFECVILVGAMCMGGREIPLIFSPRTERMSVAYFLNECCSDEHANSSDWYNIVYAALRPLELKKITFKLTVWLKI